MKFGSDLKSSYRSKFLFVLGLLVIVFLSLVYQIQFPSGHFKFDEGPVVNHLELPLPVRDNKESYIGKHYFFMTNSINKI